MLESKSLPGTAYELCVTNQQPGACTCEAARFGRECHHRRDAVQIAAALDAIAADLACIRDEKAHYDRGSAERIGDWRAGIDVCLSIIVALGYRLGKVEGAQS